VRSAVRNTNLLGIVGVLLSLLVGLSGCSQPGPTGSPGPGPLRPGDTGFPRENPTPSEVVEVQVIAPPTLLGNYEVQYAAESRDDPIRPGGVLALPGCGFGTHAPYQIAIPVVLKESGTVSVGRFAIDRFEPGKCGWHLASLSAAPFALELVLAGGTPPPMLWFSHSSHSTAHPWPNVDLSQMQIHVWCTNHSHPVLPQQATRLHCASLEGLSRTVPGVPAAFVKSVPANQFWTWSLYATQYLRTLKIQFHDLDAELLAFTTDAH
jgi:hypothetical protein